ncbi:MAG: tagaturonate reductase [Lachnospiraceae bacterium]|nr:tagaturonate reductase [Lachnospiraceae bacterium]MCR5768866.1 tagaturonate reductase [Lachnospiraceae bacterium]
MDQMNAELFSKKDRDIKVLQFGEGNFLRAFVDYMIDIMNERGTFDGNIAIVKPIEFGNLEQFAKQNCNYTVLLRGRTDEGEYIEKRVITSVADAVDPFTEYERYAAYAKLPSLRFVVSNTTEAGIVYDESDSIELNPPKSYPGKLTKLLYERFKAFDGDPGKGLVMLPVELIDDNGIMLKKCVMSQIKNWKLPIEFEKWVDECCIFTSTLVDRIVTGYPRNEAEQIWEELGYEDRLLVTAEPFALWVIESAKDISEEFPLVKTGLPVIFTDNQKPYKQRKVRILNGAHTSFVLYSYLSGHDTVLESMQDEKIAGFMNDTIYNEIIPTLDLPKEDLLSFADAVKNRFNNPFIRHELLSIALNSVSKWRARCLPSVIEYYNRFKKIPKNLAFSLAALIRFYSTDERGDGALIGHRGDGTYLIRDDAAVLDFFAANCHDTPEVLVDKYIEFEKDAFAKMDPKGLDAFKTEVAEDLAKF